MILLLASLALAPLDAANGDAATRHAEEVEAWRQERLERLRDPESWLSLVGLAGLDEGENVCGGDPASDVPLPTTAPARAGVFLRQGDDVDFIAAPGAGVAHQGEPVGRLSLADDADGEPTVLELGTIRFHLIRRGDFLAVRVKDSQSPARAGFEGIPHYPVSLAWRVTGRFEPYDPPKPVAVPTVLGTVSDEASPGAAVLEIGGDTYRLDVLGAPEDSEVFVIFADETNGPETYGGGRFLYAERSPGGEIVVDFNKAYNPPCAFTPYATCPLPPPQNRLAVAVRAGERKYGDGHP